MADPRDLGGLLYEREAELAFANQAEIEKAAEWCRTATPHKLPFLRDMWRLLTQESNHLAKFRLSEALRTGAVKRTPVLTLLTPSQALRLLECYRRATLDDPAIWKARDVREMDKIISEKKLNATLANLRRQIRERDDAANQGRATPPEETQSNNG